MCILCELKAEMLRRMAQRITPQDGMRGYNEDLKVHFEVHDRHDEYHRVQLDNSEWYAIRTDKIKVLLV